MELTVTKFIYTLFRVGVIFICLVCAQANAEQNTGAGAATDAGSKDVTVTVTRTSEGVIVITPDGRRVLLRDDHTWEVIETEQGDAASSAVITVANVRGLRNACKVGLRLENKLGYNIKSLIPSFSAHTSKGVLYETVSKAFSSIKPTRDQYQQIQFIGITCEGIGHIRVHGADNCSMGRIDKFNEEDGECLSHIYVQPSELIKIIK
jgi:hypothetical protein